MASIRDPFRCLELIAIAAALLALAGAAGAGSPVLDIAAHLAPLVLLAGLAAGIAAVLVRRRAPILAASAVAVAAASLTIAPEFSHSTGPKATATAAGQIKVIQINAWRQNGDLKRVADWLVAQDPDIVTVSEARHDLRDLLMRQGGWKASGGKGNLMIFTHDRRLRTTRPKLGPDSELTFVNATYALPGGEAEVVTTHFAWPTDRMSWGQPASLRRVVAARPTERMILAGDFNAAPWSARIRDLDRDLGLIRRDRALATWPAQVLGRPWPLPFLPIDHIYAGPGWATVKVARGPWLGSDHYPVIVTLAPVRP